jgi:hypothetical protein
MLITLNIGEHLPHLLHGLLHLFQHPEEAKYLLYGVIGGLLLIFLSALLQGKQRSANYGSYTVSRSKVPRISHSQMKNNRTVTVILTLLLCVAVIFLIIALTNRFLD